MLTVLAASAARAVDTATADRRERRTRFMLDCSFLNVVLTPGLESQKRFHPYDSHEQLVKGSCRVYSASFTAYYCCYLSLLLSFGDVVITYISSYRDLL